LAFCHRAHWRGRLFKGEKLWLLAQNPKIESEANTDG
jgi:hypothetical protein